MSYTPRLAETHPLEKKETHLPEKNNCQFLCLMNSENTSVDYSELQ
jgi:hypothetical protein